jgi:hypothetical protein
MPNNYILLDRIELNATTASVTFDNIPQSGYTDLKLVISARTNSAGASGNPWTPMVVTFNSTTTTSSKQLFGTGSAVGSDSSVNNVYTADTDNTANTFSNCEIYIPNYRSTNQKSYSTESVTENNATASLALMAAGLTNVTVAITSVSLAPDTGSFAANSTFSLYGLAQVGTTPAIAPKADGGNVIGTDGTYWYHAFLSNGTFTPQVGLTADVLVVAGGGGGGRTVGGGGGAGGLLAFTGQSLTATGYSITVGGGGSGGTSASVAGTNGVDSQFGALTLVKGGGGGASYSTGASTGGSGGGGSYNGGSAPGGSATSGQGFAGGAGLGSNDVAGGGGGGAGAVGAAGTTGSAGNGGVGSSAYSSWGAVTGTGQNVSGTYYFAGGGGAGSNSNWAGATTAGTGGLGGGANGRSLASQGVPTAATANTGGGGGGSGGSGDTSNGGNGGSGVVIIRYLVA